MIYKRFSFSKNSSIVSRADSARPAAVKSDRADSNIFAISGLEAQFRGNSLYRRNDVRDVFVQGKTQQCRAFFDILAFDRRGE